MGKHRGGMANGSIRRAESHRAGWARYGGIRGRLRICSRRPYRARRGHRQAFVVTRWLWYFSIRRSVAGGIGNIHFPLLRARRAAVKGRKR